MKTLCIDEVLGFYRKSHANCVLLFHVGSEYIGYDDDAIVLSGLLNDKTIEHADNHKLLKFPENQLEDVIHRLVQSALPVSWVEYRDENGNYVLPKVKQVLADRKDDY